MKLTREQYLLICLIEECQEVSQRATKALRFGMNEVQPGQNQNNMQRLVMEIADLTATLEIIANERIIDCDDEYYLKMIEDKNIKIEKYYKYSQEQGIAI